MAAFLEQIPSATTEDERQKWMLLAHKLIICSMGPLRVVVGPSGIAGIQVNNGAALTSIADVERLVIAKWGCRPIALDIA
jgi:hypothetical protein